jgi:alkyl hydroperoxide reductase subunit F
VQFVGIPGGHEFSSLILAILNAGGKGKLPDAGLEGRIKRLGSGATIRTYISLSCENCPDVVQALNQIALTHGGLTHVMVDGAFRQDELARLNIQGVPSVVIGDELVHSGRASLADLIGKLEEKLGKDPSPCSAAAPPAPPRRSTASAKACAPPSSPRRSAARCRRPRASRT